MCAWKRGSEFHISNPHHAGQTQMEPAIFSCALKSRESCGEREDCMRKGCTRRELHLADAKVER